MIRRVGSWPRTKAGNATDVQIDLRLRGGTVMIRRLVSPLSTRVRAKAIASMCQFGEFCTGRNDRKGRLYEAAEVFAKDGSDDLWIVRHDFVVSE